jgi:hypothetical protein
MTSTVMMLLVALASAEAAPGLPADARLAPVRAHLQDVIQRADAAGLPSDMIVSKVREGLAKGVDPARIEAAAIRIADSLTVAQQYVTAHRPGPAAGPLVRAVAEARLAGVAMTAVDPLLRGDRPEQPRAVEVVTDLSLRGYPSDRAALVVQSVLAHDARSLDRVPGALETIRQDYALSHIEAVDALARGLASADSLQTAYTRAADDERRRGHGRGAAAKGAEDDGADDSGSPGKSGLAPGQLKKKNAPPTRGPH